MTNEELNDAATKVCVVFGTSTQDKERVDIVKDVILSVYEQGRQLGKTQIINHFKVEIENLLFKG